MANEIERKFLIKGDFKPYATSCERIVQGYLSSVPDRTVRIRIKGTKGYITVKGESDSSGVSRFEWEKEIALEDAEQLLQLCEPVIIDKIRYYIPNREFTFEVDEFCGENKGLTVAEIELNDENDIFYRPEWLGEEVTGNKVYYNSYLSKHPYDKWKQGDDKS